MIDFIHLLKEKELKATPQRLSVLKELSKKGHPTIDQLYEAIRVENSSMSLATVYKNLATLKEKGVVIEVNLSDGKMRYDICHCPHIHLVCQSCGALHDMEFDKNLVAYQGLLEEKESIKIEKIDLIATTQHCKKCSC